MAWVAFISALAAFFLLHMFPVLPPLRCWLIARLGPIGFDIAYSALSILLLGFLFAAAARAPRVTLWAAPPGVAWLVLAAMSAAGLILAFGLYRPNPFSFGGFRNAAVIPGQPGLLRWIRHPILAALFLWSSAHLAANGDLAHVLMFGSFAGFSIVGMAILDRRRRKEMGDETWRQMRAEMTAAPFRASRGTILRFAAALIGLVALILAHPWFAGVDISWYFPP